MSMLLPTNQMNGMVTVLVLLLLMEAAMINQPCAITMELWPG
jgi:hypothetical protein